MNSERAIYRVIDVNLNRASEGLRVIEDGVRFILDDSSLTKKVKELRHSLIKAIKVVPGFDEKKLISCRNSGKDVGAKLEEKPRGKVKELIRANFRRVQEAQRSLEEFGKLLSPLLGQQFKRLRFQTYSLEKQVEMRLRKELNLSLYAITDSSMIEEEDFEKRIKEIAANGATLVQLREKTLPLRAFLKKACSMRRIIHPPLLFIVNDRIDIAIASGADGLHVGQEDLPILMARQILGEDKIIGISTHSIEQARQAEKEGADYLAIGPIFATRSKPEAGPPKGTKIISQIKEVVSIPVVAIGGINLDNVEETLKAGADGVAVMSAIFKERDVGLAVRKLSQKINIYHNNRKS